MKPVESANINESIPLAELRTTLQKYPIQVAILFGSHATESTHETSDIDIAVEFQSIEREEAEYNEVFFGLSADLSDVLETDDVDLVDIQTLSPSIAEAIFEHGIVLVGDQKRAEDLLQSITASQSDQQSPRERFDTALGKIDKHLGDDSAVAATDRSRGER